MSVLRLALLLASLLAADARKALTTPATAPNSFPQSQRCNKAYPALTNFTGRLVWCNQQDGATGHCGRSGGRTKGAGNNFCFLCGGACLICFKMMHLSLTRQSRGRWHPHRPRQQQREGLLRRNPQVK
jgi:hypothetical protein